LSRSRLDRDASLPLQVHGIHLRPDTVLPLDVVDDVDPLRIKKGFVRSVWFYQSRCVG
jgi:hypothetical protein